jgi:hypothetical protein
MRHNIPLFLCYDSNFAPQSLVICQQHGRIYRVYDEISLDSGTVGDVGRELVRRYPHHRAEALLFGDATAQRVSAQTAQSDYELLMEEFRRLPYPVTLQLPDRQPPVRDRINAVNFLMRGPNGEVRVEVAPRCPELIEDFETVQRDRKGGILKAHDKKDPYYQRTHKSDAFGYMAAFREAVGSVEAIREGIALAGSGGMSRLPSPGYAGLGR